MFQSILQYLFSAILTVYFLHEFVYKVIYRKIRLINKLPGPPLVPVLGSVSHLFYSREKLFNRDREIALKYFPIYRESILTVFVVSLLHPEDVEQILSSMKHISKGTAYDFLANWLGKGLLTSSGEKWQLRRKILTPAFHFNILQDFLNIFNEGTEHLVEVLRRECNKPYINVVMPITEYTLCAINETAMGVNLSPSEENDTYKKSVYRMGDLTLWRVQRPWLYNNYAYSMTANGREEKSVLDFLHKFTLNVIKDREESFKVSNDNSYVSYSEKKRLAMLDLLLSAHKEGKIDYEGIREEVDTFMFEGHDTTSMSLCFTLLLIANHQDMQEKMYEEMKNVLGETKSYPTFNELQNLKYMERFIKESLRLYPSVPAISRITGEEYTTKTGHVIPENAHILIKIYDMHHNPNLFKYPETFDPDRFLPENTKGRHAFAYIPFSGGPRNCIGQKFAMLEMKTTLCGILKEFVLRPVHKCEDVVIVNDIILRPDDNGIRIKFVPRSSVRASV